MKTVVASIFSALLQWQKYVFSIFRYTKPLTLLLTQPLVASTSIFKLRTRDHAKGVNYISNLPDDVLCNILSMMNMRDAVRTSCLSSRWRHISAFLPDLVFDWETMFLGRKPDDPFPNSCNCKRMRASPGQFVNRVNQFLGFHKGHRIRSFEVIFCLTRVPHSAHIDRWIDFALKSGVKHLAIELCCRQNLHPDMDVEEKDWYVFGDISSSFESKLESLKLRSCILGTNAITQFSTYLVSLHLLHVDLRRVDQLCAISSSCSKLRRLCLLVCRLPFRSCIELCNLEELDLCHCLGAGEVELSASKLTRFQYMGRLVKFSFFRVPNLENVSLLGLADGGQLADYAFRQLAKSLPALKKLQLQSDLPRWIRASSEIRIATFSKVEALSLNILSMMSFDMPKMIHILLGFPLLRDFQLTTYFPEEYDEQQGGNIEANSEQNVLQHLERVLLNGFYATQNHIDLVISLLKNASSLQTLIINPKREFCRHIVGTGDRVSWNKGERQKVCEALQDFNKDKRLIIVW